MCWLYILKSENGRYYVGSTINLDRRLKQHRLGSTRATKVLKTTELVYTEEFENVSLARIKEKKLKSYKSKRYIEWLINKSGR